VQAWSNYRATPADCHATDERAIRTRTSAALGVLAITGGRDAPSDVTTFSRPDPGVPSSEALVLRAAVAAYLGRYRGQTRLHTESDLRIYLRWCTDTT
jgi:hypothetical protein